MQKRAKGFYWVKDKSGCWHVALFQKDVAHRWAFYMAGQTKRYADEEFAEINEKLIDRKYF
mgnify:FL=1